MNTSGKRTQQIALAAAWLALAMHVDKHYVRRARRHATHTNGWVIQPAYLCNILFAAAPPPGQRVYNGARAPRISGELLLLMKRRISEDLAVTIYDRETQEGRGTYGDQRNNEARVLVCLAFAEEARGASE